MQQFPFEHDKFGEGFMGVNEADRYREAIPGSTNLPAIPKAGRINSESNTNLFLADPKPMNPDALGEIDSRVQRDLAAQAPGTFTQPGTSSSGLGVPFDCPKVDSKSPFSS